MENVLRSHNLIPSLSPFLRPELNGHIIMLRKMSQRVHVAWTRGPPCGQGGFEIIYHDSGAVIGSPSNWKFIYNLIWDILPQRHPLNSCAQRASAHFGIEQITALGGYTYLDFKKGKIVLKCSRAHKFGAINLSCSEAELKIDWIFRAILLPIHWQLVPVISCLNWCFILGRMLYCFRALSLAAP